MWMKIFCLVLLIGSALSLSCLPCEMVQCVEPQNCEQGTVPAICGCGCRRCAKVEGETCGGMWNLDGSCADGLTCEMPEIAPQGGELQVVPVLFGQSGICVPEA
ncbi:CRIM1 [Branchiostoma lanceolatum]|uniref:CRIM1 protein n=1 Tax=Branchiostoma lanceolatum TaxID=7740 RepID=A0A8J9ZW03_BRALA|nr:CRIM1 [Branchiostoma lanceolatum]